MAKVSVIIPVYNAEQYIEECLKSIINQTFSDYEVIIINDGSTDSSAQICNNICKTEDRFLLYTIKNNGVSNARNIGIDKSRGEYIVFFDADDILPPNCLSSLVGGFADDINLTMGGFTVFGETIDTYSIQSNHDRSIGVEECISMLLPDGNVNWQRYLWNRMLRTSIIKKHNLRFNTNIFYKEDGLFLVEYLARCKGKVRYLNDIVYFYRKSSSSAMGNMNNIPVKKTITSINAHCEIIKTLRSCNVSYELISRTTEYAFGCRSWLLNLYAEQGKLNKYYVIKTLLLLYTAIGLKESLYHIGRHFKLAN